MTAKSDYLEGKIIEHVLRNVSYTSPTTVYVGLFTSDPGEASGGTEVSGNGYARTAATFGAHSGGICSNSAAVTFPVATGSWGTVTHFVIFDASTGGNRLYHGSLTTSKAITTDDVFEFPAGNLAIGEQ